MQLVAIENVDITIVVQAFKKDSGTKEKFVPKVKYNSYMRALKSMAEKLDILNARLTTHSPRTGRAMEDAIKQMPIDQIAVNGSSTC